MKYAIIAAIVAALSYSVPAFSQVIHCTTTTIGNYTYTNCY